MKNFKVIMLPIFLFCFLLPSTVFASDISVNIDGNKLNLDVSPTVIGGRTLAPLRAILNELNVTVDYDSNTREINVLKMIK